MSFKEKAEIGLSSSSDATSAPSSSASPQHTMTIASTFVDSRPANNGPFSFIPDELMDLIDPKSPEKLQEYGGIQGVLAGLHADPIKGLTTLHKPLSAVVSSSDEKESPTHDSLVTMEDREQYFGSNVLPKRKPKSIFELMWMALQEKIL
ncbi:hypothetical protein EDD21DRAFT_224449 [Dissophora ornata]|nr:hypothetical protein EDD21DRAFT_224449 [Dissophora ornata]